MTLEEAYNTKSDYLLSENFSLKELIHSDIAVAEGIDNWPQTLDSVFNLQALVVNILQPLRSLIKSPIAVNSGYRSPILNARVDGVSDSEHLTGCAADIHTPALSMIGLAKFIRDNISTFNQLILEKYNPSNPKFGWVHVSYNRANNKKQVLTFNGYSYLEGLPQ